MKIVKNIIILLIFIVHFSTPSLSYANNDIDSLVKNKDFEELVKKGKEAVTPLILMLKSEISYDRAKAAEALGIIKDKRAISPLINLLNDSSDLVKKAVFKALKNITGEDIGNDVEEWIMWYENYQFSNMPAPPKKPQEDTKAPVRKK